MNFQNAKQLMHLILRLPDGPVEGHDYHDSKGESVASPSARNRSESMIQRAFNPPQIWYPSGNLRFTGFVSRSLKLAFESGVGMDRQAPLMLPEFGWLTLVSRVPISQGITDMVSHQGFHWH